MAKIVLVSLVWSCICCGLWRGWRSGLQLDRYLLGTWAIFVMLGMILSLQIPCVQTRLDGSKYEPSVTALLSSVAMMVIFVTYSLSLKWLSEQSPDMPALRRCHLRLLGWVPIIAALILASLMLYRLGVLSWLRALYTVKWLVEVYGFLQCALVFIPINSAMIRKERVFAMRVKHLATLIVTAAYVVGAIFPILLIPATLLSDGMHHYPYLFPRGYITALCLIVILVPHRWLALLWLPSRLDCYIRLVVLERRVERLVPLRREAFSWSAMFNRQKLEMAVYITVVNILDHYRRADLADPVGCELVGQIEALWPQCEGYDDLVVGLCHIRL